MRPDEHKSKESRRYQQKKKKEGDTSASEIAEARRRRAKANDKGTSVAAIRRRNGELPTFNAPSTSADTPPTIKAAQFSRRKVTSNQDRYKERSLQDDIDQDAELGIDRETTDLVAMLDDAEGHLTGGSTYFKFKEEQELSGANRDEMYRDLLQVDFAALEKKFEQTETRILLGLSTDDVDAIDYAFAQDYIGLDKPLIPATNKTSQGVVMLKSQTPSMAQQQNSKEDGLYLRNDRQRTLPLKKPQEQNQSVIDSKVDDKEKELDMLLGLGSTNTRTKQQDLDKTAPRATPSPKVPKPGFPKLKGNSQQVETWRDKPNLFDYIVPGSSSPQTGQSKTEGTVDDQAWLDDLLG
ncbi:hypothetical protein [Absidia glauca]|uniref:Uncharacterized protein n=1 Tax=Absidia glauca TaxID=4829 RepID=A0A168QLE7_ABSGL|nr:hypothetical protein [Absidia glauca]